MKFSAIQMGTRAERRVSLPGHEGVDVALRPLTGSEESAAFREAFEYARQEGNPKPAPGDPLYELGYMVHVLAVGVLDVDSPAEDRHPFFDGGAEQILSELPRETIHFLYQRHALWQDECSPSSKKMGSAELAAMVAEVAASEDDAPFSAMSPATQWLFTRTLARLHIDSHADKSSSGDASLNH